MSEELETMSDYEKREKAMKKEIEKMAKKSDNKVLNSLARQNNDELKEHCSMARRIFNESMDMYENGVLKTFTEFVSDLTGALKAMDKHEKSEPVKEEKKDHGKDWKPVNY